MGNQRGDAAGRQIIHSHPSTFIRPDQDGIIQALQILLDPGQVVELRVLNARRGSSGFTDNLTGYFDTEHLEDLARAAGSVAYATGIYFTLNPVLPDLQARAFNRLKKADKGGSTGDHEISHRRLLLIDLDAVRATGISSTDAEKSASRARALSVREWLTAQGWPAPVVIDSGNGFHLVYRIALPTDDAETVKRCLEALDKRFSDAVVKVDTSVYNPARITKLPGTPVRKGDDIPARPHRMAKLVKVPELLEVVPTALLEALAGPAVPQTKPKASSPLRAYDLAAFMAMNFSDTAAPVAYQGGSRYEIPCPWRPADGVSVHVIQFPSGALSAGCQHDTCPGSKSTGNHWQELRAMFESPTRTRSSVTSQMPLPPSEDDATSEVDAGIETTNRPTVRGFEWRQRGLFQVKESGRDEEGNPKPSVETWLTPPFNMPGLVRNRASRGWCVLIAWHDMDGVPHEEAFPFELMSGEAAELARTLGQGGMVLPPDAAPRKALLRYLCAAAFKVVPRVRLVETLGWQDGAFVLPSGECIGSPQEPMRFAGETGISVRPTAGTLEGWQTGVAKFAVGNPFLAFSISCAFAGPLMELVRPDGGGGFNYMGQSSKGKSTCLEVGASVWGNPHPLLTWRATGNGLEALAAARNDGFLTLDELSQIESKEAGPAAYLLANGSSKSRATKEGGSRPTKQWRLIFLSSGEQGLEDKISETGQRQRAGQGVRVPDIPCPEDSLFHQAHGFLSHGLFAEHLKAQARKHYGHAIRVFIGNLCQDWARRDALQATLKDLDVAWLASIVPAGADGQVRRVAARFSLVAIAGELAREMGILPWPEREAFRAATVCFKAWLDRRGHIGASERERGLAAVVDFLATHGLSRFADWDNRESRPVNMVGVRQTATVNVFPGLGGWDFFMTSTGWKAACSGFDQRSVARAAIEDGLLEPGPDGKPYQKQRTPHGQGQYYVIRAAALGSFRAEVA